MPFGGKIMAYDNDFDNKFRKYSIIVLIALVIWEVFIIFRFKDELTEGTFSLITILGFVVFCMGIKVLGEAIE